MQFLMRLLLGTRQALHESDRSSMTITIGEVSARSVGQLIALFERAVGFYAHYVNINAYHQPGVEAGKKAAADILEIKLACVEALKKETKPLSALALAKKIGDAKAAETVFKLLNFLSANPKSGVALVKRSGAKSTFASSKS